MTELTYAERLLLYKLIDNGPQYDDDGIEERVLINTGLAERFSSYGTGDGMVRVTAAGRARGETRP